MSRGAFLDPREARTILGMWGAWSLAILLLASAAQRLIQLGYTDVAVYEGGKQEWEQSGFPFEADAEVNATA